MNLYFNIFRERAEVMVTIKKIAITACKENFYW